MFFVLGFALIGLELFAIGPGIMAFIGGYIGSHSRLLYLFRSLASIIWALDYSLLLTMIYLKILSRGYFSSFRQSWLLEFSLLSSFVMFSDYVISVNNIMLAFISIGLAFFYFIAIPTVIRSRLTTDTSAMTSYVDSDAEFIQNLDGNAVLVKVGDSEVRVESNPEKKYSKGSSYKIIENDGNLEI